MTTNKGVSVALLAARINVRLGIESLVMRRIPYFLPKLHYIYLT
ncbi:hypothetical protein BCEN4_2610003 [Burkholderia cenocepacia]|nr:hypothetical protein BCEN4_2610003 [Burkholderia cenocepacia]